VNEREGAMVLSKNTKKTIREKDDKIEKIEIRK
jgi:hypothetical protein